MKALAFVLLLGVFIRHDSANWLASITGLTPAAMFYILGGLWEFTLCSLLLFMVLGYPYTLWRGLASAGLVIGVLEGFQIFACRLAIADIGAVPMGANLCDFSTGFPVGAVMTSLYLFMICWHFGRAYRGRSAGCG